ncbi:KPN_02809 family neutral zinc metallopeptidase [Pseudorhodoplanes sp.]|uniref:KPN_02809 family neutral zinc metallopeptidase n=1 Tax=Pseudorhodoplanes sp. TaxID=1934341 RepID=UPI002CFA6378|nr:neutral zinc metallopeptidase [Pseudorhodoplanes sp.]HWV54356.1 neutral zinc metallopeptidase [Pseudorhodoplanes sp.]
MRWDDFRRSDNIEDVRGEGGFGGGGGFPIPGGGGGLGIGTIIVLGLIGWFLGIDPRILIGGAEVFQGPSQQTQRQAPAAKKGVPSDQQGDFVAAVIGSTEDVWSDIFRANGQTYRPARLRLYSGATPGGACGMAQSAMGPFYCPPDKRIFLDTAFFREMEQKFRACRGKQCEFAQAYVIAHEVGHHVQNLLGILPRAQQMQQAAGSKAQANNIQVRVELQADCLGGVWANHARRKKDFIDPGDIEGAIGIASAIGDDRLQKQATGRVVPDSFTHGSSEQRVRWFKRGFESGRVSDCDTFRTATL